MTFETLMEQCVEFLKDVCIYQDKDCSTCPLKGFCACEYLADYEAE